MCTTAIASVPGRNLASRDRIVDHRRIERMHREDHRTWTLAQAQTAMELQTGHHGESQHRPVRKTRSVCGRHECRQLVQQRVLAFCLRNAFGNNRIRLRYEAVVDLLVVHRGAAQPGARGDCLKIGRVIAAFVDHFARRTRKCALVFRQSRHPPDGRVPGLQALALRHPSSKR